MKAAELKFVAGWSIPNSVTSIGDFTFKGCRKLSNINIPSNVQYIGEGAFEKCINLSSIYLNWNFPIPLGSIFDNETMEDCTLYIPNGTYNDYWLSDWGNFKNIVEYDATAINHIISNNDVKEARWYSTNGQQLSQPNKGINIVKYNDGSVKKVLVK